MLLNETCTRGNDDQPHDKNNNDHINELANRLKFEITLRQYYLPTEAELREREQEILGETLERILPTESISLKELAITDGSLQLRCPICGSAWYITVHERNYVFVDECKCRRCMLNAGVRVITDFPAMPILIEVSFIKKQRIKNRDIVVVYG